MFEGDMKKALLDDLIIFLSTQETASPEWEHERQRLLAEVQAQRDAILVYQSRVYYKLEWKKVTEEMVDGKLVRSWESHNLPKITVHRSNMHRYVLAALEKYPIEELRLWHGSKPIKNILAWLDEHG
jgi:hypothetical protein